MAIAVDLGRKATKQTNKQIIVNMQTTKSNQNYPICEELNELQLLSADTYKRCKIVLKKYKLMNWNYTGLAQA